MGKWLAASVLLTLAAVAAPARSEEMPWCVELDVFTKNCAFASYNECNAVANNATGPATGTGRCIRNPNYQPPAAAAKPSKGAAGKTSAKQP